LTDLLQAVNRKEKYRRTHSAKRQILGNDIEAEVSLRATEESVAISDFCHYEPRVVIP